MTNEKEKELWSGKTTLHTTECSKRINAMAKVSTHGVMARTTMATGIKVSGKAKAKCFTKVKDLLSGFPMAVANSMLPPTRGALRMI